MAISSFPQIKYQESHSGAKENPLQCLRNFESKCHTFEGGYNAPED